MRTPPPLEPHTLVLFDRYDEIQKRCDQAVERLSQRIAAMRQTTDAMDVYLRSSKSFFEAIDKSQFDRQARRENSRKNLLDFEEPVV